MKECNCKNWKENASILDSAIILYSNHGMGQIKNSFTFCPWCGDRLKKVKE